MEKFELKTRRYISILEKFGLKTKEYVSILEKFELKTKRYKFRKLKRIISQDQLQKHLAIRYKEHQDFYLYFKKELYW